MASNANSKKRKHTNTIASSDGADTSKPTALYKPTNGRSHTLSIALPGSIIANAQSHELKTALAGAIARAAAVFSVDEIVIFSDGQNLKPQHRNFKSHVDGETGYTGYTDPDNFLYHLLSYLETPPNLRKALFPLHPNLRTAGTLPSLDMPHHLRADEWCQYREGVVLDPAEVGQDSETSDNVAEQPPQSPKKKKNGDVQDTNGCPDAAAGAASPVTLVDAGLPYPVPISAAVPPLMRVTLKFASTEDPGEYENLEAEAVDPAAPREEAGFFWGYQTRQAASLSAVFTECPFDGGYDLSIGTSERGVSIFELLSPPVDSEPRRLPSRFHHMLLLFGGVAGLEAAANADAELVDKGITSANVGDIFDAWVNLVPNQGSRTIRCEEAVWLGLMGFRDFVTRNGQRDAWDGRA